MRILSLWDNRIPDIIITLKSWMDIAKRSIRLRIVKAPNKTLLSGHRVNLGHEMREPETRLPCYADLVRLKPKVDPHVFGKVILRRRMGYRFLCRHLAAKLVYAGKLDHNRSLEVIKPEFHLT